MKLFIFLTTMLFSTQALPVSKEYIQSAMREAAQKHNVPLDLLEAICWVESNHQAHAYNFGDASKENHAFGLCQVLYTTAKGLGLKDERCKGDFRDYIPSERNYTDACKLFGPKTNAYYAAKYLRSLMDRYEGNEFKATAAYNSGSYIECKTGWLHINKLTKSGKYERIKFKRCINGGPINLYYLNRVEKRLERDTRNVPIPEI